MVTFSYRTQSKNPNIASEYEWEVSILIDNWPCSIDTYGYFIISILPITSSATDGNEYWISPLKSSRTYSEHWKRPTTTSNTTSWCWHSANALTCNFMFVRYELVFFFSILPTWGSFWWPNTPKWGKSFFFNFLTITPIFLYISVSRTDQMGPRPMKCHIYCIILQVSL